MHTKGITGAAVTTVSGSGSTYTVTVKTGLGNGTVRLDLIDDDSIKDSSGNPLGGTGVGNGNFTTGQTYTVVKIPIPLLPKSATVNSTPTYQWDKVPGATQYRYELRQGTTLVYTQTVGSSLCGTTTCSNRPTTVLKFGSYQWRVQALLNGIWTTYSPSMNFTITGPLAG